MGERLLGQSPWPELRGSLRGASAGAAPEAASSRLPSRPSSERFPGPGDPRFSLRGRSVPSARGASMSEKFPKALDIAILVTFIF